MKLVPNKTLSSLLLFGAFLLPSLASASTVYIDTTHSEFFVGDTILFSVRVDSEGNTINTVEGAVLLDHAVDTASLVDINTSGSRFTLWPSRPLPSERNTRVSFAGGSPGGLVSKDAIVLNIVLKLEKEGQVSLTPSGIEVYLHDGSGTKDLVRLRDLIINVLPKESDAKTIDDWSNIVLNDKTPPEPFEIHLGQKDSVFDGKKFLAFTTTDGQSGISHYEVIEGTSPPIRSNGTYVLQQQDKLEKVTVIAYDSAGNTRESVYTPPQVPGSIPYLNVLILIGAVLVIILMIIFFRKIRKAKT